MKHNHLRRRLSLALPAFVFLSFTLAETVEVRAVTETLLSLSLADEPSPRMEAFRMKACKPMRKGASEA